MENSSQGVMKAGKLCGISHLNFHLFSLYISYIPLSIDAEIYECRA